MSAATKKRVLKFLEAIVTPEGFTRELTHHPKEKWESERYELHLQSEGVKISIDAYPEGSSTLAFSGHVSYMAGEGAWYTFDRLGVSDSFYLDLKDTAEEANATVAEQLQRVKDSLVRHANSVPLPGLPGRRTKSELEEMTRKLKAGKRVTVTPAGMGTGYYLTAQRPRVNYGVKAASPELCKLLGLSQVWLQTFDHD